MKTINLFLADINVAGNTSGVDRYIFVLIEGLKKYININICRINFKHDSEWLFCKETVNDGYTEFTVPMPQSPNEMISEKFWTNRYNENAYYITEHLFKNKENMILHLHTLNLMDFALVVRKHYPECKIITHLHCIPWKGFFNSNISRFNRLYRQIYIDNDIPAMELLVSNHSELRSYNEADRIICVTRCASDFLTRMMGINPSKIAIICNGISDKASGILPAERKNKDFMFLYVGTISPSKGLLYILEAMRKLKDQGYTVSLIAAGKGQKVYVEQIKLSYPDLRIRFTGSISFDELKDYYMTCDAGIIASLQEQCSYVAIEMSMFGMPLITTAVDGLDEMFIDEENALKVSTRFSNVYGLSADTDDMANKMKRLIDDKELRYRLGNNIRKLYEKNFGVDEMIEKTIEIYNELLL